MRNDKGQFVPGHGLTASEPIGTVRIRTRHKRGGEQRAWVKVAEPNVWKLRAQVVWEEHHGPIPPGMGVHHKDRDKLNDDIGNLELKSKADHMAEHRPEWQARNIEATRRAVTGRTWSTKSATKRVGRHPKNCDCPLHRPS